MEFRNVEIFKQFLEENLREKYRDCYNLKAYLDDVVETHGAHGSASYELSPYESKDNLPHEIYYELETHFFTSKDEEVSVDEDWTYSKTIATF